jgi:penicillin amidase
VAGEPVKIVRDDFGVPHIFAETDRGLFEAYGYVVAQDRLWQLELNRRAARGELAEVLGPGFLGADTAVRTVGYTEAELAAQFATLPPEEQARFEFYGDGINRFIGELVVNPSFPFNLPLELLALSIIPPDPWTTTDSVAFGAFAIRRFGEIGGRELRNQALLNSLIDAHGAEDGLAIFDDVRWVNDPDAPVSVPTKGRTEKEKPGKGKTSSSTSVNSSQLQGAGITPDISMEAAEAAWESIGVVTKLGSYAWTIAPSKSAEGGAMLYGGPQVGFDTPSLMHEVQLKGGDGDFNVTGMAFAGGPAVLIGRNENLTWTSTTATGDNLDTYIETLCDAGAGPGSGYLFKGVCTPFESRTEVIDVAGVGPVPITVLRSLHGPVIDFDVGAGIAVSQKRVHWQREIETLLGFAKFGQARNLDEFKKAIDLIVTSHNFLYADEEGNIAYWQAGEVPRRPKGFDSRLPLPGTGEAEWRKGVLPTPNSINPSRGWLTNWNNKPSVDFDNSDEAIFGKQFRLLDIEDRLAKGKISLADMEDIPKDIARIKGLGREARFLKPYLLKALDNVPPTHPLAAQARVVLEAWDGSVIDDAIISTSVEPGEVIFSTWLGLMEPNTFGGELGGKVGEASTNMLIHVLDDALGSGSGVPPSRDYFNGVDPNVVISATFEEALTALGPDPAVWSALPRGTTTFTHPVLGITVGSIPESNRATYAQIVSYGKTGVFAEAIHPLGQSGFISAFGVPDANFADQLPLFAVFEYKPMPLLNEP